jgi:riboflavin synthase
LFTGIIEETGTVRALRKEYKGASLTISAGSIPATLQKGDSIAVNGVCLTMTCGTADTFTCDLSSETLERSTLGHARPGQRVNLERPLQVGARLGGHFVQGHVDAIGTLIDSRSSGEGALIVVGFPAELDKYLVYKGSVAVDGISLTIALVEKDRFSVAVIPYTFKVTNLSGLHPGDPVNLETDILAKYFERFFSLGMGRAREAGLTFEYLKEQGF